MQGLPSSRGLTNLKPNPMFDLEMKKEEYPAYDPLRCPAGIIDISSALNTLMIPQLNSWAEANSDGLYDDIRTGQ
jgi:hypothetical protein